MKIREDLDLAFGSVCGPMRSENQDDFLIYEASSAKNFAERGRLFAIADGMGGTLGGALASRAAIRGFLAGYLESREVEHWQLEKKGSSHVELAYAKARDAVVQEAQQRAELANMGTTLTGFSLLDAHIEGVHVGDSRCLLIRDGKGQWLTETHNSEDSEHILTKVVGATAESVEPDCFTLQLRPGDIVLLMTDGLWRSIPLDELVLIVLQRGATQAAEELLAQAQERSGEDNASVVLLHYKGGDESAGKAVDVVELDAENHPWDGTGGAERDALERHWPGLLILTGSALGLLGLARLFLVGS